MKTETNMIQMINRRVSPRKTLGSCPTWRIVMASHQGSAQCRVDAKCEAWGHGFPSKPTEHRSSIDGATEGFTALKSIWDQCFYNGNGCIYYIYIYIIYKYAQKYYLTICFRWLLSPAPTVGGEQRRLRGTLLPGLEHDGNRALHLHLSERRPGFLGWMKAGIQSDRCFYQWIPGKTKRPKKTKRLGGSKALHLI